MNSIGPKAVQTVRLRPNGAEAAENFAARADAGPIELEQILHRHLVAVDADDFGDAGHLSGSVTQARSVDHDVDGAGKLLANYLVGYVLARHHHHGLETREGIARRVGVHGGHGAVVARVHGLQHVERFRPARFTHDDTVRTHTQGVDYKVALRNRSRAFDVHGARLQA